jgi:hypothetical protein
MNWKQKAKNVALGIFDWLKSPLEAPYVAAWAIIISLSILTLFNYWLAIDGHTNWLVASIFLGLFLAKFFGLRPTNLVIATVIGGVYGKLSGKGFAEGALAATGNLYRLVLAVAMGYLVCGTALLVIPFVHAPGVFFVMVLAVIGLLYVSEVYNEPLSIASKILTGWFVIIFLAGIFQVFNAPGRDLRTGEPLHMGYYTQSGEFNRVTGITPESCRPEGIPHNGFDYAASGTCANQWGPGNLIPEPIEEAQTRGVGTWSAKVTGSTGMPIWLIVIIVVAVAGGIYLLGGKKTRPLVIAVLILGAGWAGYTYALPALANSSLNCPRTQTIENYGDTFMLKRNCGEQLLRMPRNVVPWYHVQDGRFAGEFNTWANTDWDATDATLTRVNTLRWPEGMSENQVEVEVVTQAEAARRKRLAAAPAARMVIDVSTKR